MGIDCPDVGVLKTRLGSRHWNQTCRTQNFSLCVFLQGLNLRSGRIASHRPQDASPFPVILPVSVLMHILQVINKTVLEPFYFFIIFASLNLSAYLFCFSVNKYLYFGVSVQPWAGDTFQLYPAPAAGSSMDMLLRNPVRNCRPRGSSRCDPHRYLVVSATQPSCLWLKPDESPIVDYTVKKCQSNPNGVTLYKISGLNSSKMSRSRN